MTDFTQWSMGLTDLHLKSADFEKQTRVTSENSVSSVSWFVKNFPSVALSKQMEGHKHDFFGAPPQFWHDCCWFSVFLPLVLIFFCKQSFQKCHILWLRFPPRPKKSWHLYFWLSNCCILYIFRKSMFSKPKQNANQNILTQLGGLIHF